MTKKRVRKYGRTGPGAPSLIDPSRWSFWSARADPSELCACPDAARLLEQRLDEWAQKHAHAGRPVVLPDFQQVDAVLSGCEPPVPPSHIRLCGLEPSIPDREEDIVDEYALSPVRDCEVLFWRFM